MAAQASADACCRTSCAVEAKEAAIAAVNKAGRRQVRIIVCSRLRGGTETPSVSLLATACAIPCSHEPGKCEQAQHRERKPKLLYRAQKDTQPGAQSDLGGLAQLPAVPELAQQRTDEGPGEQSDR